MNKIYKTFIGKATLFLLLSITEAFLLCGCEKDDLLLTQEEDETTQEELEDEAKEAPETDTEEVEKQEASTTCFVQIYGAVANPGVYEVEPGSRVFQVIALAGGLLENASEESVNQAEEVTDGEQIRILTKKEAKKLAKEQEQSVQSAGGEEANGQDGKIDLNTASKEELMTLPGIGASKADSILSYREEQGGFQSTEEITNISGIKDGVYSKIKNNITVN